MIVVGGETLARKDGEGVYNLVKKIAHTHGVVDPSKHWNGLNLL